eukprot:1149467-Pelagomonas_calceolata.AAC.3
MRGDSKGSAFIANAASVANGRRAFLMRAVSSIMHAARHIPTHAAGLKPYVISALSFQVEHHPVVSLAEHHQSITAYHPATTGSPQQNMIRESPVTAGSIIRASLLTTEHHPVESLAGHL